MNDGKKKPAGGKVPDLLELLDELEEDERTLQVDMNAPPGGNDIAVEDLSLPDDSADPSLPFFLPPAEATSPRAGGTPSRPEQPPPQPKQRRPSIATFFDGLDLDEEDSLEIAVHEMPQQLQTPQSGSHDAAPPPTPSPSPTPGTRPRFAHGFTAGRQPLDGEQFQPAQAANRRHRDSDQIPVLRGPAPMADSRRLVRRRFVFAITLRDIILLLLVAVLGAGIYVGWLIYQDYSRRQEIILLERRRQLMEKRKSQQLEKHHRPRKIEKDPR